MEVTQNEKWSAYKVAFLLLAVLFCTYLRVSLLLIYPILVLFLFYIFKWKLDRNALFVFAWVFFCWILSFRNGFHIRYNIVSFYYFIPFLLLLFAVPQYKPPIAETDREIQRRNYFRMMMNALTIIAIINNIPGIIQYIIHPYDDSFVGIYGSFTVSQNGLSILNAILFFYHLTVFRFTRKKKHLLLFIFFIFCCVLGFYGAGQLALIAAIIITYLRIRMKNFVPLIIFTFLVLGIVLLLMKIISPLTYDYNVNIVRLFLKPGAENAPRKIEIFLNYIRAYPKDIADFLFGSGPGTFNSRTAFMIGSPTYFNLEFIKSTVQPHYFQFYAYPLWNASNTGPYDGFMNQPFTSILAILGEYGLIFALLIILLPGIRFYYFNRLSSKLSGQRGVSVEAHMYRFCTIYALLLIIIDNYIEYPEIIGLLLVIIKLSQQELNKAYAGFTYARSSA